MKKLISLTLILILSSGVFPGCKKSKVGEPPLLPPMESMTIDFSNFATLKKSAVLKGTENSNWEFAANAVGVWKLIITGTLAVPIASFKLAVDNDPVSLDASTWQWSYNASVASATYKVRLTGQVGANDVIWKMYITKEGTGAFSEFLWFEGTSGLNGTSGQWTLNQSPSSQGAMLRIDWTKTASSITNMKYTFIKSSDPFNTSFIEYLLTTGDLDASYTIHYYDGAKFSDVDVKWNTQTKNGRVKSLDYVGDTTGIAGMGIK